MSDGDLVDPESWPVMLANGMTWAREIAVVFMRARAYETKRQAIAAENQKAHRQLFGW